MDQKCSMCKKSKPLTIEFFATRSGRKHPWQGACRVCQKEYRKNHYDANKQKYIDKAFRWKTDQKIQFFTWLSEQCCVDCGVSDIRVLEFDHLRDKDFTIAHKIGTVLFEVLLKEIEKCDIVCRNCHAIRTAERSDWYAYLT